MVQGILDGVRIVDLAEGRAGSLAALMLAEAGADVVKVIAPGYESRVTAPDDAFWNRSKAREALDLKAAADRTRFDALLAGADMLIHDLAPQDAAALALDDATLARLRPDLIVAAVTAWPVGHPLDAMPTDDALALASAGICDEQEATGRDGPNFLRFPLGSMHAAHLIAAGALTRLYLRRMNGQGGAVRTSLVQGALVPQMMNWHRAEEPTPAVLGAMPKDNVPTIFECADGLWMHTMGPVWTSPSVAAGLAAMSPEEKARANAVYAPARLAYTADKGALDVVLKTRTRAEWMEEFAANDIPHQPCLPMGALYDDEQVRANDYAVTVDTAAFGRTVQPATPLHVTPPVQQRAAPDLSDWPKAPHAEARGSAPTPACPLAGLRVLDFGSYLAGPLGPMLLGDLGADVIKVEMTSGDPMRFAEWPFLGCQRAKRTIALQLKDAKSRETLVRLVQSADVVHHNIRPAAAARLGLDYQSLKAINPKIIFCHVGTYGPQGPRKDWPGYDQMIQAASGWEYEGAGAGNPPIWHRFGMMDHQAALGSVTATLLALLHRQQTGEGQACGVSLLGAGLLSMLAVQRADGTLTPYAKLDARQLGVGPARRLYQCRDGWVVAAAPEADLAAAGRLAGAAGVAADGLEAHFEALDKAEALALLARAGIAGAEATREQRYPFFDSADNQRLGLVASYPHPVYKTLEQPGALLSFGDMGLALDRAPPVLGQHTRELLGELGFGPAEIDTLIGEGTALAA
ncbi:MAG: CoA transferase [Sphingomonadales bacterium]|nr:CoA transferase [Sphingomonadales bacterium]MBU3993935.1 CoA transferase [Alphaproteobacteria bacterium]